VIHGDRRLTRFMLVSTLKYKDVRRPKAGP
jgi:hypothetical protein